MDVGGRDGEGGEDDGRALGDGVELEEAGPPNLAAEPARQVFRACWDPREALTQPIILPASKRSPRGEVACMAGRSRVHLIALAWGLAQSCGHLAFSGWDSSISGAQVSNLLPPRASKSSLAGVA